MNPIFAAFALTLMPTGVAQLWQEKAKAAPALVTMPDFRTLAKEALPAVVNITVEQKIRQSRGRLGQQDDLNEFYERYFGQRIPPEFRNKSVGSGFVISPDGYVLTNNHVVENADVIKVRFQDEVSTDDFTAKVVGADARTDIALLKIDAKRTFTALPLGDSASVQVGEWVMAIGNPFGLAHSISAGIVSAKDRRDLAPNGRSGLYDFIQTDASINPGNSGGPLLNLRGEVIGVNAAVNASGQGLGFAIPINLAKAEIMDLKDKGRASRSWLGVQIQRMTPQLAKSFGLERTQGAIVTEVVANGPAAKAGLQPGDVVLEFDGKPVRESTELSLLAAQAGVNKAVTVVVLRDQKKKDIKVTLGEFPQNDEVVAQTGVEEDPEKGSGALGLKVADQSQDLRERFNIKEKNGVIVVDLDPQGPAAEAGLHPGDVIVKVNDKPIGGVKDVSKIVKGAKSGEMLRMLVKRGEGSLFIAFSKP
ncbi:MAG: Do family serine endopeptidase [Deltaproteobacteria bacterium]|nr:Do family serine endopeptidase [Deltaproteobacteria bacterium]